MSLSRRTFLKLSGLGAGTALLSACGLPRVSATPGPVTGTPAGLTVNPTVDPPRSTDAPVPTGVTEDAFVGTLPVLGRPTANSIAVSLLANAAGPATVVYGTTSGRYSQQVGPVALQAGEPQNLELSGLTADTRYYYRVTAPGMAASEHQFQTQRAPGQAFTFTLDADPHHRDPNFNGALYALTLANARLDQPDFHLNLGDTFMTEKARPGNYAEAADTFAEMRPYLSALAADVPLFLVNGNHEGELGWLLQGQRSELPVWCAELRQQYYPGPRPGGFYSGSTSLDSVLGSARDGYYAFVWGDALFVVLDPFWYTRVKPRAQDPATNWNWTLGREQYDWLQATLAASTSAYTFIGIHHLVGGAPDARGGIEYAGQFEWGGLNLDATPGFEAQRPGWRKPIHALLVEHQVSAVFHGHDHVFVRQELDGVVYQELPQPSLASYNNVALAADYGYTHGEVRSSSGHLRIQVTPTAATVEYVRAYLPGDAGAGQLNGEVACRYTLSPRRA